MSSLVTALYLTVGEVTETDPLSVLPRKMGIFTGSRGNQKSVIFAYLTVSEFLPTGGVDLSSM